MSQSIGPLFMINEWYQSINNATIQYSDSIDIEVLYIRWISLNDQQLIYEFTEIFLFIQDMRWISGINNSIYIEMKQLLSYLKFWKKDWFYTRLLLIFSKYLKGIKKFLLKNSLGTISLYLQLFDSVFLAIIYETHKIKSWLWE